MKRPWYPVLIVAILSSLLGPVARAQNDHELRAEEREDYFRKWVDEDVVYIILPEEREIFQKLTTDDEKDRFIEQFWLRRDPDPRTAVNEFKEEHYRRIAYANENFKSGFAGWKTDRGRIYIIHGPPDEKESYPTGGNYERRDYEGGGFTNVYPFERWWYRHLPGVGSDVEMEFVDPRMSNEYYLAVNPEEKDALLNVPGGGPTMAEDIGLRAKKDRPYFVSNYGDWYPGINSRARDDPMRRYDNYFQVQKPQPLKYPDLKRIVNVDISYSDLPFDVREDYFKVSGNEVLAPITIQFQNKFLSPKEKDGRFSIDLAVYGAVTSLANKVVFEFEDEVSATYRPEELQQGLLERSMYQKIIPIRSNLRYKVDLVVKDLNGNKVGVRQKALIPPPFTSELLQSSSLVLSGFIQSVDQAAANDPDQMFVLGDVRMRPSVDRDFLSIDPLGVYLQLYNVGLDQSRNVPDLRIEYKVTSGEQAVREVVETKGESIHFASPDRVVLIKGVSLAGLQPGRYSLEVRVDDLVTHQQVSRSADFQIGEAAPPGSSSQ